MYITRYTIGKLSVYDRLQHDDYEIAEIEETVKHLLNEQEREFLNMFYPLGLDTVIHIFDFSFLNDISYEEYNPDIFRFVSRIISASSKILSKYCLDKDGNVQGINGTSVEEHSKNKISAILRLNELFQSSKDYYMKGNTHFDFITVQDLMVQCLWEIVRKDHVSKIPTSYTEREKVKTEMLHNLKRILDLMESLMNDARCHKDIIRIDLKSGDRYLKRYDPKPFEDAKHRIYNREFVTRRLKLHLDGKAPIDISSKDIAIFRKALSDSCFMTFLSRESRIRLKKGIDSYTLTSLWIRPEQLKNFESLSSISMETMSGRIQDSFSETLSVYYYDYISKVVGAYQQHRPETLRHLANRCVSNISNVALKEEKYTCLSVMHQFFYLLQVVNPKFLAKLPKLEQQYVLLRFRTSRCGYSLESIAKILHADLNLIKNYEVKYIKLIYDAIERYAHAYMDMEAQAKVVLK